MIAVASAVVGPSYQPTAADSFVIAQLRAQPAISTGLTYDYAPAEDGGRRRRLVATVDGDPRASPASSFRPRARPCVWQRLLEVAAAGERTVPTVPRLVSVPGACTHVQLQGRCPTEPGEIAILQADAATYGLQVGSTLNPYGDPTPFTRRRDLPAHRPRGGRRVLGWGRSAADDPGTAAATARAGPAGSVDHQPGVDRAAPAALVRHRRPALSTCRRPSRRRRRGGRGAGAGDPAGRPSTPGCSSGLSLEAGNTLPTTVHQLLARRGVARSTVAARPCCR